MYFGDEDDDDDARTCLSCCNFGEEDPNIRRRVQQQQLLALTASDKFRISTPAVAAAFVLALRVRAKGERKRRQANHSYYSVANK